LDVLRLLVNVSIGTNLAGERKLANNKQGASKLSHLALIKMNFGHQFL
jgi:hypothetical protein